MEEMTNYEMFYIDYIETDNVLTINDERIPIPTEWNSRIYNDSFFNEIAERDGAVEQIIRKANALLIDFHYHRSKLKDVETSVKKWLLEDCPEDNLFILLEEAEDELAQLFVICFRNGWKNRRIYMETALCMLYETNKQRYGLGQDRSMSIHLGLCLPSDYFQIRYPMWD